MVVDESRCEGKGENLSGERSKFKGKVGVEGNKGGGKGKDMLSEKGEKKE